MSKDQMAKTAYPAYVDKPQDQSGGPGLEKYLDPPAAWTQLEFYDEEGNPYLQEYEGRGLLKNKKALITGGDSGIGRSVAILMAREGADITIVHLPEEKDDAEWTLGMIEKAGRKGHRIEADLKQNSACSDVVEEHLKVHGRLNILVNNGKKQLDAATTSPTTTHS